MSMLDVLFGSAIGPHQDRRLPDCLKPHEVAAYS